MSVEDTPQRKNPYKLDNTARKKILIDWTSVKEDGVSQEKSPILSRLKKKMQKSRQNEVSRSLILDFPFYHQVLIMNRSWSVKNLKYNFLDFEILGFSLFKPLL